MSLHLLCFLPPLSSRLLSGRKYYISLTKLSQECFHLYSYHAKSRQAIQAAHDRVVSGETMPGVVPEGDDAESLVVEAILGEKYVV